MEEIEQIFNRFGREILGPFPCWVQSFATGEPARKFSFSRLVGRETKHPPWNEFRRRTLEIYATKPEIVGVNPHYVSDADKIEKARAAVSARTQSRKGHMGQEAEPK